MQAGKNLFLGSSVGTFLKTYRLGRMFDFV